MTSWKTASLWSVCEPFAYEEPLCGCSLYCLKIANLAKLSEEERSVLVKASVFHDSRRQDDTRDVGHGARAAENFKAFAERGEVAFDERTYLIMAYHDRDDEQGKEALRKKGP